MKLVPLSSNQENEIMLLLWTVFAPLMTIKKDVLRDVLRSADLSLSRGVMKDTQLIGIYLLNPRNEPFNQLTGHGVEGLALAVKESYRNQGVGTMLINYTQTLNYDYIWGQADIDLDNLPFWLKRRKLLGQKDNSFITYQEL